MAHTHLTAPTLVVEANGIRCAYRRFGEETGVPLLFMQHFRGGLDHWDPAITDGFSIGGNVAQAFTSRHPNMVRRLIPVGTGPRGGEPATDPNYRPHATAADPTTGEGPLEAFLYLFLSPSPAGQAAGGAFWERRHRRQHDADRPSSPQTMAAQSAAIAD